MSSCNQKIKKLIPLYYDGELTSLETKLVDDHLESCAECMEDLEFYKDLSMSLDLSDIEAPMNFHDDLMKRILAESASEEVSKDKEAETRTKLEKTGNTSFYHKYKGYMNLAAMFVFVILLSVIGLTQANRVKVDQAYDEEASIVSYDENNIREKSISMDAGAYDDPDLSDEAEVSNNSASYSNAEISNGDDLSADDFSADEMEGASGDVSLSQPEVASMLAPEDPSTVDDQEGPVSKEQVKNAESNDARIASDSLKPSDSTDENQDSNQTLDTEASLTHELENQEEATSQTSDEETYGLTASGQEETWDNLETSTDDQSSSHLLMILLLVSCLLIASLIAIIIFGKRRGKNKH